MAKNDGTPVNLLALDGGGIRGICELRVLDEIMKRVQKAQNLAELPRPCDYFHLMAGTSTGGLVAILLSRFKMTTTEAISAYYDFSGKIFHWRNKSSPIGHSFRDAVLKHIIEKMVSDHNIGELMLESEPSALSKAFVCSQQADNQGTPVRFRTYEPPLVRRDVSSNSISSSGSSSSRSPSGSLSSPSSSPSPSSSSSMDVPGTSPISTTPVGVDPWDNYKDIKIWEAARATTAAPSYFEPMKVSRGGRTRTFIDGAMGCNNPAYELVDEATALFGIDCVLGCLISLGTGSSGPLTTGDGGNFWKKIKGLVTNIKKIATDTEKVHQGLRSQIRPELDTYFRFQLPSGAEGIGLHEYARLDELSQLMQVYIEQNSSEIDKVVQILVKNAKPRGVTLGHIVPSDHGQICHPKKEVRNRPLVSEFFTGREDVLAELANALLPDPQEPKRRRQHLIYGQPGAGKSQTAAKFLDDYGDRFDMILWVDAMSEETLEARFKELKSCSEYGYAGDGSSQSLLRWLETTERSWILVFDDVRDDVSKYMPRGNKGTILFTSQNKFMKPAQKSTTWLDVMSEEDALELLLSSARLTFQDDKSYQMAIKLTQSLERLPLAIETAAAALRMNQYKVSEYAKMLDESRDDLLKEPGSKGAASLVLQAVHASFDVTYKVLNTQANDASKGDQADAARYALQLLELFSFYHNEGLMGKILEKSVEFRPDCRLQDDFGVGTRSFADLVAKDETGKWDERPWRLGIDLLISYSLVKVARDHQNEMLFSMHGLVHNWARERMHEWLYQAQGVAARLILFDSITDHLNSQQGSVSVLYHFKLLPHVQAVMKNTEMIRFENPLLEAGHYHKCGLVMETAGRTGASIKFLTKALEVWVAGDGVNYSEGSIMMMETTAEVVRRVGSVAVAVEIAKNVSLIRRSQHGMKHLDTIRAITIWGTMMIEMGNFEAADCVLEYALETSNELYPYKPILGQGSQQPEHHMKVRNALSINYFYMGELERAQDTLLEATNMTQKMHFLLKLISNLSIIQTRLGQYEMAEHNLQIVMRRETKQFGTQHLGRAQSLHTLATIHFYRGEHERALELFHEARQLLLSVGLTDLNGIEYWYYTQALAVTKYALGDRTRAIHYITKTCRRFEKILSEGHIFTLVAQRQKEVWLDEEERDLPLLAGPYTNVLPMFRF